MNSAKISKKKLRNRIPKMQILDKGGPMKNWTANNHIS